MIQLFDRCPGFADPQSPKAMLWTGEAPAQRFRNGIRDLTVDTGRGNPGAIGVQFIANNQGTMHAVTVHSGDGAGVIGLDLGYTNEQGPCLIERVRVVGFDIGIFTRYAVDSVTLREVDLDRQIRFGLYNDGQCLAIETLTSRNRVPAVYNAAGTGLIALLGARLIGDPGAAGAAIVNQASLYARHVEAAGSYGLSAWKACSQGPGAFDLRRATRQRSCLSALT